MISGLILAAGESSRMNYPKALLKLGEETFAELIARKMRECGIGPCFLIAGSHSKELKESLSGKAEFKLVENPRFKEGQISSLKVGLKQVPLKSTAVLVWPVDQPLVKAETVQKILSAFQEQRRPVTIPVRQAKRGHPVVYDAEAVRTILSLDATHTAKDLQAIYANKITFVEVEDPGVLIDIDTPEDYQKYVTDGVF